MVWEMWWLTGECGDLDQRVLVETISRSLCCVHDQVTLLPHCPPPSLLRAQLCELRSVDDIWKTVWKPDDVLGVGRGLTSNLQVFHIGGVLILLFASWCRNWELQEIKTKCFLSPFADFTKFVNIYRIWFCCNLFFRVSKGRIRPF